VVFAGRGKATRSGTRAAPNASGWATLMVLKPDVEMDLQTKSESAI
jgi:hypothetical protein